MGYTAYLGHTRHHLGTLAAAAGRPDEAVRHLEIAVLKHEELASPPFVALSQRALARALTMRDAPGDDERAARLLADSEPATTAYGLAGPSITGVVG
jgi:hypothetical protein